MIGQLIPILFYEGLTPEYKAYKVRVAADSGTLTVVSDKNFSDQIKSLKQAGVYDQASLICIPSGGKAGKLYSLKPTDGTGDFTVARNSVKWVLGKDGYYHNVPVNEPALEWSPTAQKFGVLTEAQRTNLLTRSYKFGYRYWAKSGTKLEGDAITAGVELVTNGTFTSDTLWTKGVGWSIDVINNKLVANNVINTAALNIPFSSLSGIYYKVEFDILDYSAGYVNIQIGGSGADVGVFSGIGHKIIYYLCESTTALSGFFFFGKSGFTGSISSVSVKIVQGFDCPFVDSTGVNLKRGFKLSATGANGYINLATALTVTAATAYTNSIFVKRLTGTGAVSLIDTNGTDRAITITSDWQRFNYTATSAGTTAQIGIKLATSGDEVMICQGDVIQADNAGSPIFTDGATVTRLADVQTVIIPADVSEIITTVNGVDVVNSSPTPGAIYTIPDGFVTKIVMI